MVLVHAISETRRLQLVGKGRFCDVPLDRHAAHQSRRCYRLRHVNTIGHGSSPSFTPAIPVSTLWVNTVDVTSRMGQETALWRLAGLAASQPDGVCLGRNGLSMPNHSQTNIVPRCHRTMIRRQPIYES